MTRRSNNRLPEIAMSLAKSFFVAGALRVVLGVELGDVLGVELVAPPVVADDLRVVQLQQDVRDLQHAVQLQARRIETLEQELARSRSAAPSFSQSSSSVRTEGATVPLWLTISNWDRVHIGSVELDVIGALGPPSAIRKSDDGARQTLLYSLEIAAGGFLTGQVILNDHRVVQVQKPALK